MEQTTLVSVLLGGISVLGTVIAYLWLQLVKRFEQSERERLDALEKLDEHRSGEHGED